MTTNLQELLLKEKFANSVWGSRGLKPSSVELCKKLQSELNSIIQDLINIITNQIDIDKVLLLQNAITNFNKYDLDSEEKELIVDYFAEISKLLDLGINKELDQWLYGFVSNQIIPNKNSQVVQTISKSCTSCETLLNIDVLKMRSNVPAFWLIVQCENCDQFNLLSIPENVDRYKNGKFFTFETLKQNENSFESACKKMEYYKAKNLK